MTTSTPSSARNGEAPYPIGQFFEASPYLNLLLYPEAVKFKRRHQLDPAAVPVSRRLRAQEKPYTVPTFAKNNDGPLLYVCFGSRWAPATSSC